MLVAPDPPSIVILAGPNGAGKTTAAPFLLLDTLAVEEFVNADAIARGLSGFHPESVAIEAGRLMLARLAELARRRATFAFETTLASRSFAPWLRKRREEGYLVHLIFLSLPSPEVATSRVAARVNEGGHYVEDETVRRRFNGGLRNFFQFYRPICTTWGFYDASPPGMPTPIAVGEEARAVRIFDTARWQQLVGQWGQRS